MVYSGYAGYEAALAQRQAVATQATEILSGPQGRKYALYLICFALAVGVTGQFFFSMLIFLTAFMLCTNGGRANGPLMPLALFTAIYGAMQFTVAFALFIMVLVASPTAFCARASALLEYASGRTVAPAPPYQVRYPYNMTASVADTASDVQTTSEASSSQFMATATSLHVIACGKNAEPFILAVAGAVLAYAMLICLPIVIISSKLARIARAAGGCDEFSDYSRPVIIVQADPRNAAVGVPVRQAANVRVAPAGAPSNLPVATAQQIPAMH